MAAELLPACGEVYRNMQIVARNFIGYCVKLNRVGDIVEWDRKYPVLKGVIRHTKRQQLFYQ